MANWARASEKVPRLATEFEFNRRVYRAEFAKLLGYGLTWFARVEQLGLIPPGRRDPGGKRWFWLASDVHATLAKLNAEGGRTFPDVPSAKDERAEEPAGGDNATAS